MVFYIHVIIITQAAIEEAFRKGTVSELSVFDFFFHSWATRYSPSLKCQIAAMQHKLWCRRPCVCQGAMGPTPSQFDAPGQGSEWSYNGNRSHTTGSLSPPLHIRTRWVSSIGLLCDRYRGPCFHQVALPIYKSIWKYSKFPKWNFEHSNSELLQFWVLCLKCQNVEFSLFLVRINGWYAVMRIEEKNIVCAISRKLTFGWKTYFFGIGGPKIIQKWQ